MALFKCKMCGGTIEFEPGATVGVCDSCGTQQTLPKLDDNRRANLYDRANHFRRNNEFDKAMGIYEQILNEDNSDAEAYWSLVLCRYGIEYVEDPSTHKRVPTVNRAQYTSIFADEDYKSAIEHADGYQKSIYEEEAKTIDEIQKGILAISEKEEPFDVFICYKETDNSGRRTQDSVLANDLYHQLTQEGFKVFFARITLEDKLGTAYEPYIFAALNSAKVMVVLGTKPEYFNAVWVKNEWSRYLALVKKSGGKKVLIPAYKDMDPYDLPEEFSHLQAQDMSKLGFMQDLIRGIKKIAEADAPKVAKETVVINSNANAAPLLKRAFMFLEDGDFAKADDFCEQVLNIDPENGEAYLGKLMAQMKARRKEDLKDCAGPFDGSNNYRKAVRFGGEKLAKELQGYMEHIRERNENERIEGIYAKAQGNLQKAGEETEALLDPEIEDEKRQVLAAEATELYRASAEMLEQIAEYKDVNELRQQCEEGKASCHNNLVYATALNKMAGNQIGPYEEALEAFGTISGWKDADTQADVCRQRIEEIKIAEETARIEAERARLEAERKERATASRNKRIVAVVVAIVAVGLTVAAIWKPVIAPISDYRAAKKMFENGQYDEAITAFQALGDYKDSKEQIEQIKKSQQYDAAVQMMNEEQYLGALTTLTQLGDFKDCNELIENCKAELYENALQMIDEGNETEALLAFQQLGDYEDSPEQVNELEVKLLSKAKVGSTVFLGSYELDEDITNGNELIEWVVLDKKENKLLIVSKYAVASRTYNIKNEEITWESCSLREWMNNDFFQSAFTPAEQNMIATSTVKAEDNPQYKIDAGNDTKDRLFLLSITEARKYFDSEQERVCKFLSTDNADRWWLRSPGIYSTYAANVNSVGSIYINGKSISESGAVRPALWVSF